MTIDEMRSAEEQLAKMLIDKHAGDIVAAGLKQLARRPIDRFVKWYQGKPAPASPEQVAAAAMRHAAGDMGAEPAPVLV